MRNGISTKGFTLVELAIVMTIIGLLIGGILKGQELMQNSRITATISQTRAYEAALTTFRDKYDALPGDMSNAATRLPGCNSLAACNCLATATLGNSVIGNTTWSPAGATWTTQSGVAPAAALSALVNGETVLFWTHLLAADLISGVTINTLTGATALCGETHPGAKIGGGFIVGQGNGNRPPGAPVGVTGPNGLVLALVNFASGNLTAVAGQQPLTPTRAAQIDRKMDDGQARSGYVEAYGTAASCFTGGAAADSYAETVSSFDCGLIFRFGG